MTSLLSLENGRIRLIQNGKVKSRYISWNIIENGQILDINQVYYHLHQLLEDRKDPVQVFFPGPKVQVFSYPGQGLSLGECKKIESFHEEEKKIRMEDWSKFVFPGKRRFVAYYDKKSMTGLEEIFSKLGCKFERIPFLNQDRTQVLAGPEYAYFFTPFKEDGLKTSFSKEAVDYFIDRGFSSKEAYSYLDRSFSPEKEEDLSRFLTIFYLERFSDLKEALKELSLLAMEDGLYRDYLKRFQDLEIEDLDLNLPEKEGKKDLQLGSLESLLEKKRIRKLGPVLVLGLLFLGMGVHYRGLQKELNKAQIPVQAEENRLPSWTFLKKIDLDSIEDLEFDGDKDQCQFSGKSSSLDHIAGIKDQISRTGLEVINESIDFQDGSYQFHFTLQ